jgi:two-component system, OmpR family, osmolarity sensor histidine kinase EnvZ
MNTWWTHWAKAPRFNSLFTRLLLAQLGLVLTLGLVFGSLFYVERNTTVAVLYANLWAPHLLRAMAAPATEALPYNMQRTEVRPAPARIAMQYAPRFVALRQTLAARGVPVDEVIFSEVHAEPTVWLHVNVPGRTPVWFGVAAQILEPAWPRRLLLAFSILAVLLITVSWAFTRRLTQPLEQLHTRMQTHTPGTTRSVALQSAPRRQGSPEIQAIDAAYTDLLGRIERHERERAVLLAGVSHDLRSPLGRIRLAADLLPEQPDISPRKASIVRNVAEADRLVESFLDFVRSGELALDQVVDLAAIGRAVVAGFERSSKVLSITAPDALPWPLANQLLVERLMANLVDNALKHGLPPVHLTIDANPLQAWIEVQDCGEGIAPQAVSALQEAFTRGNSSRTDSGSGLGLAIVRQVVSRLGGELSFERVDGGQKVRVTLRR